MKTTAVSSPLAPAAAGGYSQAVAVEEARRLLFVSGQIPQTAAGDTPADFRAQAQLVWANLRAQLEAANMTLENVVKVTIFLSSREYAEVNREVRQSVLGSHAPALTVIITGIFDPAWLLEIEAIAAA
jgi:2-iminobutanoate/2-iminopropanoate deaminase